jgi:hypothetical protein
VPELDEKALAAMLATDDAKAAGVIYMLRSLSEHPDIKAVPNLYKIGLARRSIESRIQNAAKKRPISRRAGDHLPVLQCESAEAGEPAAPLL